MKNMSKRTRWIVIVVGIVVVIGIVSAAVSSKKSKTPANEAKTTPVATPAKAEATVGQPVTSGDLTLTVAGWKASQGDDFSTPAEGSQFIVVDLEVANNGSNSVAFSTMLELSIATPEGRKYTQGAYFPEPKYPDGQIAAGGKARGNVAFEVPTTVSTMFLAFDPVTGEGVRIKLQ